MDNMGMWVKLNDVQLWGGNSNEGSVGAIAALIERVGFRNPIGLDANKVVKNGNHRVIALRQLQDSGWKPFGACIRTTDSGEWEIQYIDNSDLSEDDSILWALGDNRTGRLGRDDAAKLTALLIPLEASDILAIGYDESDLEALQNALTPSQPKTANPDYIFCPRCGERFKK